MLSKYRSAHVSLSGVIFSIFSPQIVRTPRCVVDSCFCVIISSRRPIHQVYVASADAAPKHTVLKIADKEKGGPNGERFCWYQCTVKGGREGRDIDAMALAKVRGKTEKKKTFFEHEN